MKVPMQPPRRSSRAGKIFRVLGCVALVLSLLVCTWLMNGMTAYGWMLNSGSYGAAFSAYGGWTLALAGGMTVAVVLCLCKIDLPAAILGTGCYAGMLCILLRVLHIAEEYGWSGQTEKSFGITAAEVWKNACTPNILTVLLLLILTLTHFFSYDAAVRRKQKRDRKNQRENAPAPSILGGE